MNCTVLSKDSYLRAGIASLYSSLAHRVNFQSAIFIDVMSAPDLDSEGDALINTADLIIFIVDSTSNVKLLKENVFLKFNNDIFVKYICRDAQQYEFEDLLGCDISSVSGDVNERSAFNTKELSLISCISTGQDIYKNNDYQCVNKKTLSSWKRNIMKKLDVTTDVKLYDVIMKCTHINRKLSSLCY